MEVGALASTPFHSSFSSFDRSTSPRLILPIEKEIEHKEADGGRQVLVLPIDIDR